MLLTKTEAEKLMKHRMRTTILDLYTRLEKAELKLLHTRALFHKTDMELTELKKAVRRYLEQYLFSETRQKMKTELQRLISPYF